MRHVCASLLIATACLVASMLAQAAPQCGTEIFPTFRLQFCRYTAPGPLLVLDAAQGTGMEVWNQDLIKALNGYADVLTYNRVGSGESGFLGRRLDAPVTAKDSSERLHLLLQRLYPGRQAILVGHSIGGLYAQYFARAYPQQLSGLVLIDAASALEPKTDSPFKNKSDVKAGSVSYFEDLGFRQSVQQIEQAPAFPDIALLVISADNHDFPAPSIEALWQDIQKQIARQSPRGKQVTVPHSEHFVFIKKRERVVQEIRTMVEENGIK